MSTTIKSKSRETGLICPTCGCRDLRVYYTRAKHDHILRKRICRHCAREIVTRERIGR